VNSIATEDFWDLYWRLPAWVRRQAREAYHLFEQNPHHPSLHFKRIHATEPIYSVRITADYRAVGLWEDDLITWFWIGPHTPYERLLKRL
jgi:hypothetical protein